MAFSGRGRLRRAFVFSLDAFTAFSLVLMTIYSLFMLVSIPKGYYSTLEQAYDLAKDTLTVLDHTRYPVGSGESYTDRLYADSVRGMGCATGTVCDTVARRLVGSMVPRQWGYAIDYSEGGGSWAQIYDSSTDTDPANTHAVVRYRKLAASAKTIISTYSIDPLPGESPYCYITGRGYSIGEDGLPRYMSPTCNVTVCDAPTPNFKPGDVAVSVIRITVFT